MNRIPPLFRQKKIPRCEQLGSSRKQAFRKGFTLVEMVAAMAVLLIILAIIGVATNSARTTMQRSQGDIGAFVAARSAFQDISDKLSQATLNTYWDYYDANGKSRGAWAEGSQSTAFVASVYGRASDLHFKVQQNTQKTCYGQEVYFQTPEAFSTTATYQDTQGLLNGCSYFVEYCPDNTYRASPLIQNTVPPRWRYRLMQGLESTESLKVYANVAYNLTAAPAVWTGPISGSAPPMNGWITNLQNELTGGAGPTAGTISSSVVPLADNVIAMIIWPRQPMRVDPYGNTITTDYSWDSQKDIGAMPNPQNPYDEQLPPIVQLTLVVIDEASATRIATNTATEPAAITTAFNYVQTTEGQPAFSKVAAGAPAVSQLSKDLTDLTTSLAASKVNYRILNTVIVMKESKWSQ